MVLTRCVVFLPAAWLRPRTGGTLGVRKWLPGVLLFSWLLYLPHKQTGTTLRNTADAAKSASSIGASRVLHSTAREVGSNLKREGVAARELSSRVGDLGGFSRRKPAQPSRQVLVNTLAFLEEANEQVCGAVCTHALYRCNCCVSSCISSTSCCELCCF